MKRINTLAIAATLATGFAVPAQAARFTVSLESEFAGAQESTSGFFAVGVERFDGRATGEPQSFATDFGGSSIFSGVYSGVGVNNDDQYGGALGTGQYANAQSSRSYTLSLSSTEPQGVTYFGFWLSALDGNNNVTFRQNGSDLFTFTAQAAREFIDTLPDRGSYFGNPNATYGGQNSGEPYSFLNFYARGNTRFDEIVFSQGPGGGLESDNHTVGRWSRMSGTAIPLGAVPEPATWAMLVIGFGLAGTAARRRRRHSSVAA